MVILFSLLGAATYALTIPARYTTTSIVLVKPIVTSQDSPSSSADVNMATEAALVMTEAVAGPARTAVGWSGTVSELLKNVGVTNPPDSDVLLISYTASSSRSAQSGANAFAAAYLATRLSEAQRAKAPIIKKLSRGIVSRKRQINAIDNELEKTHVDSAQFRVLAATRDALANQLQSYQQQLFALSAPVDPGSVVTPADLPTSPSGVGMKIILLLGLLAGLFLGVLAAFLADRRDDRVRARSDVENALNAPVIAIIPPTRRRFAARRRSHEPASSAIQGLAFAIDTSLEGRRGSSILLAGPTGKVDVMHVVEAAGRQLAHGGTRVVLMSTLPTRRFDTRQASGFETEGRPQEGSNRTSRMLQTTDLPTLSILPPGSPDGDREEDSRLASRTRFVDNLVADGGEIVLAEGHPLITERGMAWVNAFNELIVVADARVTTNAELAQVRFQLEQAGARVWGAILLNLSPSVDDYLQPLGGDGARRGPTKRAERRVTSAASAGEHPGSG